MRQLAWIMVLVLTLPTGAAWALEDVKSETLQSAAVATGNGTALDVANYSSVALSVTIADTATVTFEGSEDGSTYASKVCTSIANTSGTLVTSATATGTYQCSVAGLAKFRARVSAWTAGAVTVLARATTADIGGGGGGAGGGGGTQYNEDAAHSSGDTGTMALGVRKDTAASLAGSDGDYTSPIFDSTNRQWVNTEMPDAAALADNTVNPTVPGVAAFLMCYDGATWDRCQGGLTDTDDGTVAGSQVPSLSLVIPYEHDGTNWTRVRGQNTVAHDAADAGNPIKMGAKAETSISGATAVADGDRTNLYAGIDGVLITRPHSNLEDRVSAVVGVTDGSSTSLVAAQGAGIRFCATTLIVSNSSATNVTVDIRDGTAGSVIATIPAAANMGGAVVPLQTPLCTTANTAMAMDPSASATTVTVTAIGFKTAL